MHNFYVVEVADSVVNVAWGLADELHDEPADGLVLASNELVEGLHGWGVGLTEGVSLEGSLEGQLGAVGG